MLQPHQYIDVLFALAVLVNGVFSRWTHHSTRKEMEVLKEYVRVQKDMNIILFEHLINPKDFKG